MSRKSNIVSAAGLLTGIFTRMMAEVEKKGGGEEDVHRLTTPEADSIWPQIAEVIVSGLQKIFKVWRTIKLGTGLKTSDDFRKSIKANGMNVGDRASDILEKPDFTSAVGETEVDLVKVTVAGLGFKQGARRDQIYERARELGLELCPPEVGPQLRLQYKDQPIGEWLLIAMEPFAGSDGCLRVFDVWHDGRGLWLDGYYGRPGYFWGPGSQWVFVRPRK